MKSESGSLFYSVLSGNTVTAQHKRSLNRVKQACDALDYIGVLISVDSVTELVRIQHGKRVGPTAGSILNQKETLLRYIQLRRQEQIKSTNENDDEASRSLNPEVPDHLKILQYQIELINKQQILTKLSERIAVETTHEKEVVGKPESVRSRSIASLSRIPGCDEAVRRIAITLLSPRVMNRLSLEIAKVDEQRVIRSKHQHWILFSDRELRALESLAGSGAQNRPSGPLNQR